MAIIQTPSKFLLLDDGSWLIMDAAVGNWFHTKTLIPFIGGFGDKYQPIHPGNGLAELMEKQVASCTIGFEFHERLQKKMKASDHLWEIWIGEDKNGNVRFFGLQPGKTFKDACINMATESDEFAKHFNQETLRWSHAQLFDNEQDARDSVIV